ncbi:PIN domain-containing protein [Calorimonas adulescens]|uniref:Type II toxin-antitoxin system VapC family toxin n=1 Tax=Calorimonas adulescens TaxID=2606906 RepID=A0A5D8QEH5_9THEO|nr:PIN domain-containing protein [Calorimonas adulescens]TZE82965.1 type II toxin-antitoxin system VapC family toxin [Calorimonas adulescens]
MRIYLDNCCFNRPFDDQTQMKIKLESEAKLYIQDAIHNGLFELVWSYILDYENAMNPFEERKITISSWKNIANFDCDENDEIILIAENLEGKGIKAKDALHLACAIYTRCKYFLTTDIKLLKRNLDSINIVNPVEFVRRWEDDEL